MDGLRDHVVVGVAGGPASHDAVAYAAREAALRGTALELVHVIPPDLPLQARPRLRPGSLQEFGTATLEQAERVALTEAPCVPVSLTLTSGRRTDSVLDRAECAALLVVGAPKSAVFARPHPGSLVTAAVLRAPCPVTVVPRDEWTQTAIPRVVVGLKWPPHGDEALLGEAFDLAERRHCDLQVVHACRDHPASGDPHGSRHDPGWVPGVSALIEERLALFRRSHRSVHVGVEVVRDSPSEALSAAAQPGTVVILSRTTGWWPGRVLGPTTRGLLQHARCPVEVVPVTREHEPERRHTLASAVSGLRSR